MSFKDGEIQAVSILGTAILTSLLTIPVLYLTEKAAPAHEKFDNMESIEASIAYKKTPQKQPQKQTSQPIVKKDEGVSHDETKKPPIDQCKADSECKPDEKCKSGKCVPREEPKQTKVASTDDVLQKFHHADDDADPGKPTTQPGEFNGNEEGWAPVTQGDPFWQGFVKDIRNNFTLPTISETNGPPEGCFHITADGKIADTKIKKKSDSPDLELAAENALDTVKKLRNDNPVPVPTQLLGQITRWICFRFDPNKI
jgi:hypothetical protein